MNKKMLAASACAAILFSMGGQSQTTTPQTNDGIAKISHTVQTSRTAKEKKQVLNNLFTWLNALTSKKDITQKELNHFFNTNIVHDVNEQNLSRNIVELQNQFSSLLSDYENVHIDLPVKNLIISGNEAAVTYDLEVSKKKVKYKQTVTSVLKFSDNKISSWKALATPLSEEKAVA